ncbi:MAG: NAD-dependent epimerase/dehydratase family protein [Candidatus Hodarchaeota archaeon]
MKVFVTGATGFIGGHLVDSLVQDNIEVVCLVRKTSNTTRLEKLGVELRIGNLDGSGLQAAVKDIDIVYHLGAYYTFLGKKHLYEKFNVQGTEKMRDAALNAGVRHFIYCSTTEVLGTSPTKDLLPETASPNPQYKYGRSKQRAEEIIRETPIDELPWTIARPTGVMGPRQRDDIAYYFIRALAKRELPGKFFVGKGNTFVHFTHVFDIIHGLRQILKTGSATYKQTYHLASDNPLTVKETIETICEGLNRNPPRFHLPVFLARPLILPIQLFNLIRRKPAFFYQMSTVRVVTMNRAYSNVKAKEEIAFSPQFSMREAILATISAYKEENII